MIVLSSLEEAIFDVVSRKGLVSFNRLTDILYHNYNNDFIYRSVFNKCKQLLRQRPPRLKVKQIGSRDLSVEYLTSGGEESEKQFWFYYLNERDFNRRKDVVFGLAYKWVYKLVKNKGNFFRDLIFRTIEKIISDSTFSNWTLIGKEVRNIDDVELEKGIDVLVKLPDRSLMWIECKNQTKIVTGRRELHKLYNDVESVQQLLPELIFRRAIVCPFMSRLDQQQCSQGIITYPVVLNKMYIPNNQYIDVYNACIEEYELDTIVEKIDVDHIPNEVETLLKTTIINENIVNEPTSVPWYYVATPE